MTKEAAENLSIAALTEPEFRNMILEGNLTEEEIMARHEGAEFPDAMAILAAVLNGKTLTDIRISLERYLRQRYEG